MKTEEELRELLRKLYWDVEDGTLDEGVAKLHQLEVDAARHGISIAAETVKSIAKLYDDMPVTVAQLAKVHAAIVEQGQRVV